MRTKVSVFDVSDADVTAIFHDRVQVSLDTDERACIFLDGLLGESDADRARTKMGLRVGQEIRVCVTDVEPGSKINRITAIQIDMTDGASLAAARAARLAAPRRRVA